MDNELREVPKKRRVLFGIAGVLILIGMGIGLYFDLTQTQSLEKPGSVEKISLADVPSLQSAPLYVAFDKGYFKKEGLDVSLQQLPYGRSALDALLEGKANFATVADTPIMTEGLQGTKIWVIATISESSNVIALVARKDRGILTPGNLRGKRIGVARGTAGEFFFDLLLTFNRISKGEVRSIPMPPDKAVRSLLKGEVDAVVTWDPFKQRLQKELGPNGLIDYGQELYKMTWNVVAMQDYVKKNPEVVKKILRTLIRAAAFINEKPMDSRKISRNYLKMNEDLFNEAWDATHLSFGVTLSPTLLMNLEDQARWSIRNKLTDKKVVPNYFNYIYFEGLKAIDPDAVAIVH